MLWLLAQAETVVIQEALKELKTSQGNSAYIFGLFVIIISCGAFYVLRYMMTHTREIHAESHASINAVTERSHQTISGLSERFSEECSKLREQGHRDISLARDMVHAARDLAQSNVSQREFIEKMQEKTSQLKQP